MIPFESVLRNGGDMPDIPDIMWLLLWVASMVVLLIDHLAMRRVKRQLSEVHFTVHQLLHRAASHQRSIGVSQSTGGVTPNKDKAYALPRDDIPATGRQHQGLRFERKGGNDGSNTPESRLRQRGRRAPATLRRTGGEGEAEAPVVR